MESGVGVSEISWRVNSSSVRVEKVLKTVYLKLIFQKFVKADRDSALSAREMTVR